MTIPFLGLVAMSSMSTNELPGFPNSGKPPARSSGPEIHLVNGNPTPSGDVPETDHGDGPAVYEVIRLVDGVPLFFEEHLERMRRSAAGIAGTGTRITATDPEVRTWLRTLVRLNRKDRVNTRLVWSLPEGRERFIASLIPSHYPGPDDYARGVSVVLYRGERDQPGLKTLGNSFKERVRQILDETGSWEALLVGRDGAISEGSRSNVFFIGKEGVYTPPSGTVLMGVTRSHVLAICRERGIPVREERVRATDLAGMDALFLTGTSVDVLPVASVDGQSFASPGHPLVRTLLAAYREKVREYIAAYIPKSSTQFAKTGEI